MALSDRKQALLRATIDTYIETAEPVGSNTLTQRCKLSVSPATVRNDLNELEKDGYLTQLHTSSGRVPTDQGYRLYVDSLMTQAQEGPGQQILHLQQMQSMQSHLSDMYAQLSKIMASLINYTTIVLTPNIFQETLKVVHLVMMDMDKILVVLLHSAGVNKEFVLEIDQSVTQEDLNKISKLLTEKLDGKTLSQIDSATFSELLSALPRYQQILDRLLSGIQTLSQKQLSKQNMLLSGTSNMLKLPEFKNIEFTQRVLSGLEEQKVLLGVLNRYLGQSSHQCDVLIGKQEHQVEELAGCSLVLTPFTTSGSSRGVLGVVGPKRMAYSSVVSTMQSVSSMIDGHLSSDT